MLVSAQVSECNVAEQYSFIHFRVLTCGLIMGLMLACMKPGLWELHRLSFFTDYSSFEEVLLCTLTGLSVHGPVRSQDDRIYKFGSKKVACQFWTVNAIWFNINILLNPY